nr:copia protein [Tanacetum cinerariifolium]
MAMLTVRARRFPQRTGRNLKANGPTLMGFDMSKVECYNCHRKGHFARECRSPKDTRRNVAAKPHRKNVLVETSTSNALVSQCSDNEVASCSKACTKAYATLQSHYDKLTNDLSKSQFDVISYKTGLEFVEARLLVYQQNETVFEEDIKLLKLKVQLRDNAFVVLRQKFKKAEQERDDFKLKLEKFQTSSKNLSHLLASQTNDKTELGCNTQIFTSSMFDYDEMFSSETNESLPASPKYDRYHSGDGYHVVPPLYTGTFMPPKPDLVFHDVTNMNETVYTAFNVELSPTKPDKELPSVKPVENSIPAANHKTIIPMPKSHGNSRNRKACFVCKSLTHLIKDCDYYEKKIAQTPAKNDAQRGNHQQYSRMTLLNPQRHVVPTIVLTKSKLVPLTVARQVTTVVSPNNVTRQRPAKTVVTKPYSPPRRNINRRPSPKASTFPPKVIAAKAPMINVVKGVQGNWGNPQHALKDKGVIDSGCSRHMIRNMSYLFDFEEINGGYVAFGGNPKGGKIYGKGTIRTGKLDFNDVYIVKELKFNLFSVSKMCDKKNSFLFTDTECIVLSHEFKLPDENQVLLRVPRENNMYNVDLKNIVPSGYLTCLFAKTTLYESNLWHRRLGHINFKTMNKLAKGNLVRGLPTEVFENNYTCVAYKKGKQHRASCKTKPVNSNTDDDVAFGGKKPEFEREKPKSEVHVSLSSSAQTKKHDDKTKREAKGKSPVELSMGYRNLSVEFEDFSDNSINEVNVADSPVPAVGQISTNNTNTFSDAGPSNTAVIVRNKAQLVAQGHTQEEGIDYEEFFTPVARIEAIRLFLAYASFMGFMVYQIDVKNAFLYGTIEEEVYVCQPLGFEDLDYPDKVYKVVTALYGLHQAPRAWYETLANYLLENGFQRGKIDQTLFIKKQKAFEKLMKDKFQMSSIGELTFFLGLQVKQKPDGIFISHDKYVAENLRKFGLTYGKLASTPIDTEKPLLKDHNGEDVDVHTYRSIIGSLMYLTSSRPDIMFAVCACAHFQVTPKVSHLHAVNRIFRYLKGKPHLGLWYPKDSPFNLVAYSDSDCAGASLNRKSITGSYQFLGFRLISWQCKKQIVVATSSTEAEKSITGSCQFLGFRLISWQCKKQIVVATSSTEAERNIPLVALLSMKPNSRSTCASPEPNSINKHEAVLSRSCGYCLLHPKPIPNLHSSQQDPYELVHNKKPDFTLFRVFGALCYPTNDTKDLGKLQPTSDIGIFVGYAPSKKGYRI